MRKSLGIFCLLLSFLSASSQNPSFRSAATDKSSVFKNADDYEQSTSFVVLGDFKAVKMTSIHDFEIDRQFKIKILRLDDLNFHDLFGSLSEKVSDLTSLKCSIYFTVYNIEGKEFVKQENFRDSELIVGGEFDYSKLQENLKDGHVLEIGYSYKTIDKEDLHWEGWGDIPIIYSEYFHTSPFFYTTKIDSESTFESKVTKSRTRLFKLDTLLNSILFPYEEDEKNLQSAKRKFLRNHWIAENVTSEEIGRCSIKLNNEEFRNYLNNELLVGIECVNLENDTIPPSLLDSSTYSGFYFYDIGENNLRDGEYKRKIKIGVLNNQGAFLGDFQTLSIPPRWERETKKSIKATVFTKVGDKYEKSVLDQSEIFKIETERSIFFRFAAPNVSEGSFIFVEYTLKNFALYDWGFQRSVPILHSKYTLKVPDDVGVSQRVKGDVQVAYQEEDKSTIEYYKHVFVASNVLPFKREPLISSESNYKSAVTFNLTGVKWANYWADWKTAVEMLNKLNGFNEVLESSKNQRELVKELKGSANSDRALVDSIYSYVLENFKWNGQLGIISDAFKLSLVKEKIGNVAAINLHLTSLLRDAGFNANPVIMKTRSSGIMDLSFPRLDELNYLICAVNLDDQIHYIDATDRNKSVKILPERALNSFGMMITDDSNEIVKIPESQKRKNIVYLNASIDEKGILTGEVQRSFAEYAGYELRSEIDSTSMIVYKEGLIESSKLLDISAHELNIENDNSLPVKEKFQVKYDLEESFEQGEEVQLTPIFFPLMQENPLKSNSRRYPVSLSKTEDFTYILNLSLPENMEITSHPQSEIFYMIDNGDNGTIKSVFRSSSQSLQLTFKVSVNKSFYLTDEYELLKGFYDKIIQINNSPITISKI